MDSGERGRGGFHDSFEKDEQPSQIAHFSAAGFDAEKRHERAKSIRRNLELLNGETGEQQGQGSLVKRGPDKVANLVRPYAAHDELKSVAMPEFVEHPGSYGDDIPDGKLLELACGLEGPGAVEDHEELHGAARAWRQLADEALGVELNAFAGSSYGNCASLCLQHRIEQVSIVRIFVGSAGGILYAEPACFDSLQS
jgi:hypothetical protein